MAFDRIRFVYKLVTNLTENSRISWSYYWFHAVEAVFGVLTWAVFTIATFPIFPTKSTLELCLLIIVQALFPIAFILNRLLRRRLAAQLIVNAVWSAVVISVFIWGASESQDLDPFLILGTLGCAHVIFRWTSLHAEWRTRKARAKARDEAFEMSYKDIQARKMQGNPSPTFPTCW